MPNDFIEKTVWDGIALDVIEIIESIEVVENRTLDAECKQRANYCRRRLLGIAQRIAPEGMDAERRIQAKIGNGDSN